MTETKETTPKGSPKEPASKAGKKEAGKKEPPKISKEQAEQALNKAGSEAKKPEAQRTPQETLKTAQNAVEAVKARGEEIAPYLKFLENVPILTQEALAPEILKLFHPEHKRKFETDPHWLIRKAQELQRIARETGADWHETSGFIHALSLKAIEVANKEGWTGEKFVALARDVSEVEQFPEPSAEPARLPGEGIFERQLFDQQGRLVVEGLPEDSLRAIMTIDELTKTRPQAVSDADFQRAYRHAYEGVEGMKKREGESDETWRERRLKAWGALEPYFEKISDEIRKFAGPAPGVRERFFDKIGPRNPNYRQFVNNFIKPENYKMRDEEFYAILSEIIETREEPARQLYSLYEQSEMSNFMNLVRSIPGIGRELADHYTLLKRTIMQCHDIDYYAADPAGEVKSYLTSAALFRNEYWVEAHKDPLTEVAMRCYYQALMMIRDNNNGFLPPGLVETGYLDSLAEELFIQRIKMGQVHDSFKREDGTPVTNKYGKPVLKEQSMSLDDVWDKETNRLGHRGKAALQIAKGCNIVQLHFLELIAYTRVPGFDAPTRASLFSSKPYEGLARWINWMGDLAGKYKWGECLHFPFFSILANRPQSKWSMAEIQKVIEAADEGRLDEVFGEGAQRMIDIPQLGSICGWGGPHSKWRILDATHYWDDQMKETLGGGIGVTYAGHWAESQVRREMVDEKYRQLFREQLAGTGDFPKNLDKWTAENEANFEEAWLEYAMQKEVYGGKIKREWLEIQKKNKGWIITPEGRKKIDNLKEYIKQREKAYKAMALIQLVMRNPVRAASILELKRTFIPGAPSERLTLRDKIVREVLGIKLSELSGCYAQKFGTPTKEMIEKQNQVAELEGAIAALHEKTIKYVLDEHGKLIMEPRDLADADFDAIPESGDRVTDLREKAKQYWQMVKEEILGSWSGDDWKRAIGGHEFKEVTIGRRKEKRYALKENIGNVLEEATKEAAINGQSPKLLKLLDKKWHYLFAPEDLSWGLLDIAALGGRHPLRRAGDFGAYITGVQGLSDFVKQLTGKPDFDELLKQLRTAKFAFQDYDPAPAYEAGFRFADAMIKLYDRANWAQIPLIGDYLKAIRPSSIAKEVYGITSAIDIGPNKKKELIDGIVNMGIIPPKEWVYDQHFEYHGEKLAAENGAQTYNMIIEMVMRGAVAAAVAMVFAALTKKEDEE